MPAQPVPTRHFQPAVFKYPSGFSQFLKQFSANLHPYYEYDAKIAPTLNYFLWLILSAASLFAQIGNHPADLTNASVRYVSTSGRDTFDGSSWSSAKATVAAALNSLPTVGSPPIHYGTIYIGPGTFVEAATPIEFNAEIHLDCASSGDGGLAQGTVIQLAGGRNTALFSYTPAFASANGYAHFLQADNCTFDGNSAANPTAPALVQIYNGGFQNTFRSVGFQNATGYALRIDNHAVNFSCFTCTWGNNGGALYLNDQVGGNVLLLHDSQMDNSGVDPIYIAQGNGDTGDSNVLTFINLKAEATTGSSNHTHVIHFAPRPAGGGHPMNISIVGLTAINMIGAGTYAIYEDNNPGYAANWEIAGINASGYLSAFKSAKTGQTSAGLQI